MNSAIRIGIAVLVVTITLFCPVICSASSMSAAHPCCPSKTNPLQDDCGKASCFMDSSAIPEGSQLHEVVLQCTPPVIALLIDSQPSVVNAPSVPVLILPISDKVVTFHQFLI